MMQLFLVEWSNVLAVLKTTIKLVYVFPEVTPVDVLMNDRGHKIPVTYSLYFGEHVEVSQSLRTRVSMSANLLDLMRIAERENPIYRWVKFFSCLLTNGPRLCFWNLDFSFCRWSSKELHLENFPLKWLLLLAFLKHSRYTQWCYLVNFQTSV